MKKKKRKKTNKRVIAMFSVICIIFQLLLVKIAYLQNSSFAVSSVNVGVRSVSFGPMRGYIYDRNDKPLVNNVSENYAAVIPVISTMEELKSALPEGLFAQMNERLSKGYYVLKKTDEKIPESDGAQNITVKQRYSSNPLCPHILGYLDTEAHGVCGIERDYDSILYNAGGSLSVEFSANARGQVLLGDGITVCSDKYDNPSGVKLTIDSGIQRIAEEEMRASEIQAGACVILDVYSAEILAVVSIPEFDINNLAASLSDENLPFLNRALSAYPVGSVFKPFIAAAAMESGIDMSERFICEGKISADGQVFHCYNRNEHGDLDFTGAVCHSCNAYFINLGLKTGAQAVCSTCNKFGFGHGIKLSDTVISDDGNMPQEQDIISPAQLANLSFGQGRLLATPLQLAAAYAVIANSGTYTEPYLLKALINSDGAEYAYYKSEISYRAVSRQTASYIAAALHENMLSGTGVNGNPSCVSAAGKTATAQTGIFDRNGREELRTWFAGFFPYEAPRYSVVVFNEKGSAASVDCAPVFKNIAQRVYEYEQSEAENPEMLK